jgi:hypothetical protein
MKVPERYYDEIFEFLGQWDVPSRCGLKIVKGARTVVIVTELYQDNPGTSVTYAGRSLARQVCAARGLDPDAILYLECNPCTDSKLSFYDEEYFEVTFREAAPPAYRHLSREEIETLLTT